MNKSSTIRGTLFVSNTDLANNSAKFAADSQRSFFSFFLFLSSLAVESAKHSVLRKKCCSHTRWWYACALCFWQRLANGICKEICGLSLLLVHALLRPVFLPPLKTNISKFQFNKDRGTAWKPAKKIFNPKCPSWKANYSVPQTCTLYLCISVYLCPRTQNKTMILHGQGCEWDCLILVTKEPLPLGVF